MKENDRFNNRIEKEAMERKKKEMETKLFQDNQKAEKQ